MYATWDLKTGDLSPRYGISPKANDRLLWVTNAGHVYDGLLKLDPTTGAAVLRYEPGTHLHEAFTSPGVLLGVGMKDPRSPNSRKIWAWPTPQPEAQAKANATTNLLAAGSRISIDLSAMEGSPEEKQQLQAALTEQFAAMNVSVAPGQATTLIGRTTSQSKEKQYRDQRTPFQGETQSATSTRKITTITLEHNNQPVWQVISTTGGSDLSINVRQGESLQNALDREAQVKISNFTALPIPQIVPAPSTPEDVTRRQLAP